MMPSAPPATPFSARTSGDLMADRRYAYADAALAEGDFAAARDLFTQALERAPDWPPAHFALARACLALGDAPAAQAALRQVLELDPDDRLGAGVLLARITGGEPGRAAMPDAYVAGLFDEYAPRFDSHLVEALDYCAPEMLAGLLRQVPGGPAGFRQTTFHHALDLGCGTGLMARALPGACAAMTGVDLSPEMIRRAGAGGLYARLECTELLAFLRAEPDARYDLALAADVFCYVPGLAPVFDETFRVLVPGGFFAFSVQVPEAGVSEVRIGADSRVHHPPARIRAWGAASGFHILAEQAASTRKDRGEAVPGALFVLSKG